ncbi:DNA primase catalytic subunit PriS [uncultured Methanosphaera sp.]|jgi:DNA primase small subunit|uniref:DNA primase catalytic subunit PriS n=1 Tax=uncultured Methanosphaera sp. TaxID=262501 RepID=UPI000DC5DD1F|nr:DNA primase catalytic subunit PriS [uncultured Methanosphaera sp.]RAP44153.1 MAG: DNA primase [Methanosphaera sp. SHI1033]
MEIELKPASKYERRIFYKEEWNVKDVPDFIVDSITSREFGFDHYGQGPNDRYKTFPDALRLKRFIKVKQPFAAYCSVAFYEKPKQRKGWQQSELVFDVDAKDIPIRTCDCKEGEVCDKCLNQAKDIVLMIKDVLNDDFGLKNINMVYSGRGYHVRVLDEEVMDASSDLRGQIVQYVIGAKEPDLTNNLGFNNLQHFIIPYGYPYNFTRWAKYTILHLTKDSELDNVNKKLLRDVLKERHFLEEDSWGLFRANIGPIRYKRLISAVARVNMGITDTKVSIDLKRILRLPSTLHSKVSMKSTLIKNIETFDPFDDAVPQFVYDRK